MRNETFADGSTIDTDEVTGNRTVCGKMAHDEYFKRLEAERITAGTPCAVIAYCRNLDGTRKAELIRKVVTNPITRAEFGRYAFEVWSDTDPANVVRYMDEAKARKAFKAAMLHGTNGTGRHIERYESKPDWYLLKESEIVRAAGSQAHCEGYDKPVAFSCPKGYGECSDAGQCVYPGRCLQCTPDITLANKRVVTHIRMANGAQFAEMADGKSISESEWEEYCKVLAKGTVKILHPNRDSNWLDALPDSDSVPLDLAARGKA